MTVAAGAPDDPMSVIRSLIDHTGACDTGPHGPVDEHDLAFADLREILMAYGDVDDPESGVADQLAAAVKALSDPRRRDERSMLALELSLCPMHLVDYAICFDDENYECYAIREVFPSHDK